MNNTKLPEKKLHYNPHSPFSTSNKKREAEEKTEEKPSLILTEDALKKLSQEKETYIAAREHKLRRVPAYQVLEQIKKEKNLDDTAEALAIVALMFQQGGTTRSCDGNTQITLYGQTTKLAEIRKALKDNHCNKAERKLARFFADEIQQIAQTMEVQGNLAMKITRNHPERQFTKEELTWLSDFQSDNENCPAELRTLILETFQNRKKKK